MKYSCDVCGKKFYNWSNKNQHMILHTGLKPYECRWKCGLNFASYAGRMKHERITHYEENPLECHCDICGRPFQNKEWNLFMLKTQSMLRTYHLCLNLIQYFLVKSFRKPNYISELMKFFSLLLFLIKLLYRMMNDNKSYMSLNPRSTCEVLLTLV